MRHSQKRAAGFTLIELLVVVAIIALLISILLPSLARARELSKRTVCAANVKGIGNGFATYATGNADDWPIPAFYNAPLAGTTNIQYEQSVGYWRGSLTASDVGETTDATTNTRMSTTRAFWYLVRSGSASPKSFICPSSEDQPNSEDNPQNYWDFGVGDHIPPSTSFTNTNWEKGWSQCSYGYQVPYGKIGKPNPNVDQDMALVADKGPYGAALEGGKTAPTELYASWGASSPNSTSSPDDWRRFNSPNHGGMGDGEGQNVMYADAHVDFIMNPMAGVAKDNIYTRWANDQGLTYADRIQGMRPGDTSGTTITRFSPYGATDSLIYP